MGYGEVLLLLGTVQLAVWPSVDRTYSNTGKAPWSLNEWSASCMIIWYKAWSRHYVLFSKLWAEWFLHYILLRMILANTSPTYVCEWRELYFDHLKPANAARSAFGVIFTHAHRSVCCGLVVGGGERDRYRSLSNGCWWLLDSGRWKRERLAEFGRGDDDSMLQYSSSIKLGNRVFVISSVVYICVPHLADSDCINTTSA